MVEVGVKCLDLFNCEMLQFNADVPTFRRVAGEPTCDDRYVPWDMVA